ncbi:MAG: filamentous hemagglutinin N-terminal domain-containing protein [Desulfobacterales bacterium]|nr:filamentous hemagglutinin N-terminal domain-containing protein [Desulfobacterales bacterium]
MMKCYKTVTIIILLTVVPAPVYSDGTHPRGITLDGTTGNAGALKLPGPDYDIKAEYGQQTGTNLFHSFQQFNVHSGESATFSGPGSVQNIIARVTGGNSSRIDGKLCSAIPDANLYMLNPAGIMFGPNCSLDISGSFHVSTADYLRMGENEKYFAMPHDSSVLSASPPAAFGFMGNSTALITIEGRGEITEKEWNENHTGLHVSEGKTVSVIAGNIEMKKGTHYQKQEHGNPVAETIYPGDISAPDGRINMAGVLSGGEAVPTESDLDVSSFENLGDITLSDKSVISAGGNRGGNIFIRGERFVANNSSVLVVVHPESEASESDSAGRIDIEAGDIALNEGGKISSISLGPGRGGDIFIKSTGTLTFSGTDEEGLGSGIYAYTTRLGSGTGNAGDINIEARQIMLTHGGKIASVTSGTGHGGNVSIKVNDILAASGKDKKGLGSGIYADSFANSEVGTGNAGNVEVKARQVKLADGGRISSETFGSGQGGDIVINAADILKISGTNDSYSGILAGSNAKHDNGGNAGDINIQAGSIELSGIGIISSSTQGSGQSGNMFINTNGQLAVNGDGSYQCGIFASSFSEKSYAEDAGYISIKAGKIILEAGGKIVGATTGPGNAGTIAVEASEAVKITGKDNMEHGSGIYVSSHSEADGSGAGGIIFLSTPSIEVADGGTISTSSEGSGNSGAIILEAGRLTLDKGASVTSASNFQGKGGKAGGILIAKDIEITSEDKNITEDEITILSPTDSVIMKNSSISTSSYGQGKAGGIYLEVSELDLDTGSSISSKSESSVKGGDAGLILIKADSVRLNDNSSVTTKALMAGGGQVAVKAGNRIYLADSRITTSVEKGTGNGGDINISSESAILNHGDIEANAEEGDGGAIFIHTGNYMKSADSRVTATSRRGNDGTVKIEAPDFDVTRVLTDLSSNYLDIEGWIKTPCSARTGESASRFVIKGRDAVAFPFDDWLPSPSVWDNRSNE